MLAARAELKHDAGLALFYGAGGRSRGQAGAVVAGGVAGGGSGDCSLSRRSGAWWPMGMVRGAGMVVHAVFVSGGDRLGAAEDSC